MGPDSLRSAVPTAANYASIAGLIVSLAGFALAIWQIVKARKAADAAVTAANRATSAIIRYDAAMDLASASAEIEEAKRLNRAGTANLIPDRYVNARRRLIAIRSTSSEQLKPEHEEILQTAIQQLAALEREVERGLAAGTAVDAAKHNELLTRQGDRLVELAAALRKRES
jgi:hypothetical protein